MLYPFSLTLDLYIQAESFEEAKKLAEAYVQDASLDTTDYPECELKAAIKSVGGCYIWDIYDGEAEYPIIAVNMDSISLNPTDVEIYEVQIVNNVLKIKGRDKESREVVEFEPNDVFAGHLSYIIDYLPGDEDVSGAN